MRAPHYDANDEQQARNVKILLSIVIKRYFIIGIGALATLSNGWHQLVVVTAQLVLPIHPCMMSQDNPIISPQLKNI